MPPVEQINTHEDEDMEQSPRGTVVLMGMVLFIGKWANCLHHITDFAVFLFNLRFKADHTEAPKTTER